MKLILNLNDEVTRLFGVITENYPNYFTLFPLSYSKVFDNSTMEIVFIRDKLNEDYNKFYKMVQPYTTSQPSINAITITDCKDDNKIYWTIPIKIITKYIKSFEICSTNINKEEYDNNKSTGQERKSD